MVTHEQMLSSLFAKLATVFPMPALASGQALQVAANCGPSVTEEDLNTLAGRIIESRKQKTFPSVGELITLVKSIRPLSVLGTSATSLVDEMREEDEKHIRALRMLRGTSLADRAIVERWAPSLIEYTAQFGHLPDEMAEVGLKAKSRANDVDARDLDGPFGGAIRNLRETMHQTATRRLSDYEIKDWIG